MSKSTIVTTHAHLGYILKRWERVWRTNSDPDRNYVVIDSETEGREGYGPDAALVVGRSQTKCWAICYNGEAYTLPTAFMGFGYPDPHYWDDELQRLCVRVDLIKVFHNFNYDNNVLTFNHGVLKPVRPFWCTMVGAWGASPWLEKTLKARMADLGRQQRATKTVDFNDPEQLADYAQGDVIGTEELYLLQRFGVVHRQPTITLVDEHGKLYQKPNPYYDLEAEVRRPYQTLSPFMSSWLQMQEFPYLDVVCNEAERFGTPIDVARLREIRVAGQKLYKEKLAECTRHIKRGHTIANIFSTQQVGKYLLDIGLTGLKKTAKGRIKLDDKTLADLAPDHPFLAALREVKAAKKMLDAFVGWEDCNVDRPGDTPKSGIEFFVDSEGYAHPTQNSVGAVTGRTSCSNFNEQQIPSRKDTLGIRACFTAFPITAKEADTYSKFQINVRRATAEMAMTVLDHSQLELRAMCLLCEDEHMTKVLSDKDGDLHNVTAVRLAVERVLAKQLNFLLQYGGNEHALAAQLRYLGFNATEDQVVQWRADYDSLNPRVSEYRDELVQEHIKTGFIRLFCGRPRHLPDIDPNNNWSLHKAETTLSNNAVQGSGQDFLKAAVVRCCPDMFNPDEVILRGNVGDAKHRLILKDYAARLNRYRMLFAKTKTRFLMQVHDEVKYVHLKSASDEVSTAIATIMSWRHYVPALKDYSVPLIVEGGAGPNWAVAKKGKLKIGYEEWARYAE